MAGFLDPDDETLGAYQQLIKQGKVRTIGASNYSAQQMRDAFASAAKNSLPRYQVVQPEYNLYNRSGFEAGLRDLCVREGLGVIPYFGLASGFLTGKYRSKADFGKSARGPSMEKYLDARGLRILSALDTVAGAHGAQPAEVALAWLMRQPAITAPIASATSREQLESLVRATALALSDADLKALSAASA